MADEILQIGGKDYPLKKFTLGNYPEAMAAMKGMAEAGEDVAARTKAVGKFLSVALGVAVEETVDWAFDEATNAMGKIIAFNKVPKA